MDWIRRSVAHAPVRVADVGGWTDTWFGSPGRVCNVAVGPGVTVKVRLSGRSPGRRPVKVTARDLGISYRVGPGESGWAQPAPGRQPLIEHAIGAVLEGLGLEPELELRVSISSSVPPGASLGTSAAVVVGVIGALDGLFDGGRSPAEIAVLAHQVETARVGRQSGVQDQWAAALGGFGLLSIAPYPDVRHRHLSVPAETSAEIGRRLITVAFGAHDSSAVHEWVINAMTGCGGAEHDRARSALARLAALADDAANALTSGAVDVWGEVLIAATAAQESLHPGLLGPAHQRAITIARSFDAVGWKVNGAGGSGGSLTVLAAEDRVSELHQALAAESAEWKVLDLAPSAGLSVQIEIP